ncbi:MAG: GNAT family N-acetyltransferase [bacterium]|nr:GNAT family N-acetyltransferase [bacterium]
MEKKNKLILETERLVLRNLLESDLDDFLEYRCDPEVAKYQGWEPFDKDAANDYIMKFKDTVPDIPGKWMQFGIVLKSNNKLIGDCAFKCQEDEPRIADIGASLSRDYQGKGYATETMIAVFGYLFGIMKLHRIIGVADAENRGSIKLMERLGMRKEGHYIKNIFFKGAWGDECLYAMLEEEWPGHAGRGSGHAGRGFPAGPAETKAVSRGVCK